MSIASIVDHAILREMQKRLNSTDDAHRPHGIPVVDYDLYTPFFRQTIALALEIVRRKDPRRFRRICRYVKGVVALPIGHAQAGYIEQLQVCAVRFQPPSSKEKLPKWGAWYALMLVHEATHGLLYARGIPYDEKHRERIERLCFKEENRFLKRLGLTPESLAKVQKIKSFNPDGYHRLWTSSLWQRLRQSVRYQKAERERRRRGDGATDRKA
jgi:hypothetical protein